MVTLRKLVRSKGPTAYDATAKQPRSQLTSIAWYALHCRSQYESRVRAALDEIPLEAFWASVPQRRRTPFARHLAERDRVIQVSLLPGYVFARFDPRLDKLAVIRITGVVRIVGFSDREPAAIPDSEIDSLRILIAAGPVTKVDYDPQPGDPIRLKSGPLAGCEGYVTVRRRGQCRVLVQIQMLQQAVSAEVDASWLTPLMTPSEPAKVPATSSRPRSM